MLRIAQLCWFSLIRIALAIGFVFFVLLSTGSVARAGNNLQRIALDLTVPMDVLNYKPSGRVLALHIKSTKISPDMRRYAIRVAEKIDLLFEEDRILDENGKYVCANAEIPYRITIRSNGALELFEIAHNSSSPLSDQDIVFRDALSSAVHKSAPFEIFLPEQFLGFDLVGLEATFTLVCKRPRFIPVKPRSQSGW